MVPSPPADWKTPEGIAQALDVLLGKLSRPQEFLAALGGLTRLPLALLAPWGEVLAWWGRVPARHPTQLGRGRSFWALEAGEWRLIAYGGEAQLEEAAPLLALAQRMLRLRAMEKALERTQEENLGAAFLDELLLGEADLSRAFAFGFEAGFPLLLALIEAPTPPGRHRLAETRRREVLQGLKRSVGAYLERLGTPYLISGRGTRAVVLWQAHDVAKEVQTLLWAAPQGVRMGYSALHRSLEEVSSAYREALIALKAARWGEVVGFEGLDPVAWVLLQHAPEDLKALVERFLPLSPKELRTLERYLEHSGDLSATAQALHVHPNTLRYRLQKIEQRLGASLKSPETLAQVHLALRAKGLLEA
ncbi:MULTISPECIES: CdaR family transcriptional regulator [unclassified Meiothermus]|uniref:PucR family transcriptional regulator n=1 Tax=unclassified Meiothermus TaxID=370471 RepID=UPI000D7C2D3E|nr:MULTISPECIES: helix-turn-helix domain-containing protein [unclassified Meiothermus]PZA08026.1 PucR family transcriptional regulator [Meiothermus sp. Pnk-1]RYM32195.1 PucR family transcriptional regulator [Meiothermus sp. PNK-Is4]